MDLFAGSGFGISVVPTRSGRLHFLFIDNAWDLVSRRTKRTCGWSLCTLLHSGPSNRTIRHRSYVGSLLVAVSFLIAVIFVSVYGK